MQEAHQLVRRGLPLHAAAHARGAARRAVVDLEDPSRSFNERRPNPGFKLPPRKRTPDGRTRAAVLYAHDDYVGAERLYRELELAEQPKPEPEPEPEPAQ
jgi:hypothetical protein